jgi:hypothetical protein
MSLLRSSLPNLLSRTVPYALTHSMLLRLCLPTLRVVPFLAASMSLLSIAAATFVPYALAGVYFGSVGPIWAKSKFGKQDFDTYIKNKGPAHSAHAFTLIGGLLTTLALAFFILPAAHVRSLNDWWPVSCRNA